MRFARHCLSMAGVLVVSCALGCKGAGAPGPASVTIPPTPAAPPSTAAVVSPAASDAMAPPPAVGELRLASSSSTSVPVEGFAVYVSRSAVYADKPPKKVLDLPAVAETNHGISAVHKRSGVHDLFLVPLSTAVPSGVDHAVVYFDRDTPYRIVVEVLFTLGVQKVSSFQLTTVGKSGKTTKIDFSPPSPPTPCANGGPTSATMPSCADVKVPPLNLTILLVQNGIALKTRVGNVAPGCNDIGVGLTLPKAPGAAYDFAALAACATRLRDAKPEFERDDVVIFSANADMPFESVVAALDAVRTRPDGRALFTKVQFALAR